MKDDRGLTLVEVLMAMLISFIVFLGLTETIVVAVRANVRNGLRDEGVRVAETEMNAVRATPFDNLVSVPANNITRTYRQMTKSYSVKRDVTPAGDMKQVVVTVSWNLGAKTDNTAFTTIVRKK